MKRLKIEDMPVKITYSNKNINKDNLYRIFCDIIDREMIKDNKKIEGDEYEKKCMPNEG